MPWAPKEGDDFVVGQKRRNPTPAMGSKMRVSRRAQPWKAIEDDRVTVEIRSATGNGRSVRKPRHHDGADDEPVGAWLKDSRTEPLTWGERHIGYTRNAVAFGAARKQARRFVVVNRTAGFADVGIMQYVGYCKPTLQVGQMKRFCFGGRRVVGWGCHNYSMDSEDVTCNVEEGECVVCTDSDCSSSVSITIPNRRTTRQMRRDWHDKPFAWVVFYRAMRKGEKMLVTKIAGVNCVFSSKTRRMTSLSLAYATIMVCAGIKTQYTLPKS